MELSISEKQILASQIANVAWDTDVDYLVISILEKKQLRRNIRTRNHPLIGMKVWERLVFPYIDSFLDID
jgi:hypothetical protein